MPKWCDFHLPLQCKPLCPLYYHDAGLGGRYDQALRAWSVLQLVTRLRMLDKGTALIDWRLRGQLGLTSIDIDFVSKFELDLITGRVRCFPCTRLAVYFGKAWRYKRSPFAAALGVLPQQSKGVVG